MSSVPEDLKYTREHEWIRVEESAGICGITDHAQEQLTDIVYVELPREGLEVRKGEQVAVVESVKAVSDVYAPVSGTVTSVNKVLENSPELVNSDPYGEGWIFRIEISGRSEIDGLLSHDEYLEHLEAGD